MGYVYLFLFLGTCLPPALLLTWQVAKTHGLLLSGRVPKTGREWSEVWAFRSNNLSASPSGHLLGA